MEEQVQRWARARQAVMTALADHDSYMKPGKGGGKEVVSPLPRPLADLWNELASAEAALYTAAQTKFPSE